MSDRKATVPDEVVKRLDPTKDTLATVYLYSGNQCAFPDCGTAMFQDGQYVGELCHIEAAMTDGERFNPNSTNEERRHESNLMLMCGIHHRISDNVEKYPVERMRELKSDHERPFRMGFNNMLLEEILDRSAADILVPAKTTAALCDFFLLGLNVEEAQDSVRYWREFGEVLAGVTKNARMLLAVAIKYAHRNRDWGLTVPELSRRTQESEARIGELAVELEQSGIAHTAFDPEWYEHSVSVFVISSKFDEQLRTLVDYAVGVAIDPTEIVGKLRFDLLD
ncbi:hypothetical protein [Rhodococcus sp. KRD162]|uniref:hypothetical protein n=1 Tax=Rhodococcus sp. KRD162 TaxID=2729725 RepID=UPI0019D2760B|nr:hypothetical protein [Rhodococcus sp. KRD162]